MEACPKDPSDEAAQRPQKRALSFGTTALRLLAIAWLIGIPGCVSRPKPSPSRPRSASAPIPRLGFAIQAGAFAHVENAVRLSESLQAKGLEATHYAAPDGLFKVRFGDFPTKADARERAEALRSEGLIQEFFVVVSGEPPVAHPRTASGEGLRANLAETAKSYLGVPYLWGGTTERGFDCSGLTLAVYRLNGLRLPRSSRDQYEAGSPVGLDQLREGDLLFFATEGGGRVSHVGLYLGDGVFIHAPGRGRSICKEQLSDRYFQQRFVGARTYV